MRFIFFLGANLYPAYMCYRGEWQKAEVLAFYWYEICIHYLYALLQVIYMKFYWDRQIGKVEEERSRQKLVGYPSSSKKIAVPYGYFKYKDNPVTARTFVLYLPFALAGMLISGLSLSTLDLPSGRLAFYSFGQYLWPLRYAVLAMLVSYLYPFYTDFIVRQGVRKETKTFALVKPFIRVVLFFMLIGIFFSPSSKLNCAPPMIPEHLMFYFFIPGKIVIEMFYMLINSPDIPEKSGAEKTALTS